MVIQLLKFLIWTVDEVSYNHHVLTKLVQTNSQLGDSHSQSACFREK